MSRATVAVLGANGAQAGSLLRALSRARNMDDVVVIDRHWDPAARASVEALGCHVIAADLLIDRSFLAETLFGVRLVINATGPFYALGTAALELTLKLKCDYLDICDDIDATEALLARDSEVRTAGARAVIGLGSSPGMTNILIRTALDALGSSQDTSVDMVWAIDALDMTASTFDHMIHCFATALPGGTATAEWNDLEPEQAAFPKPLGSREAVRLGHPETVTVPRFTDVTQITNKGAVIPGEYLHIIWALARAADTTPGEKLYHLYKEFDATMGGEGRARIGSGLIINVAHNGKGYRFCSAAETTMSESTGVPAAAGALMLLEDAIPGIGTQAPECLRPTEFFAKLRQVSPGGGGLRLFELREEQPVRPARIRDLLNAGT